MTASTTSPDLEELPDLERDPVRDALTRWRDALLQSGAPNPLVTLEPCPPGVIAFGSPSAVSALDELARGRHLMMAPAEPGADPADRIPSPSSARRKGDRRKVARDVLSTQLADGELTAALRPLLRPGTTPYLMAGSLHWVAGDDVCYRSPLLLIPVERIDRPHGPAIRAVGDPVVNPVLAATLAPAGVTLPLAGDLVRGMPAAFLDGVSTAVAAHPQWRVDDHLALADVPLERAETWRDLLEHADRIGSDPLVRALAGEVDLGFEPGDPERVDDEAPAAASVAVLDADAHQRVCIEAARLGRSFVIEGPPGTGKSQTVANIVATLMHAGRTVLVVSPKIAALETVRHRLTEVGLGGHLLALHGAGATRAQVSKALATALATPPTVAAPFGEGPQLQRRTLGLNATARAATVDHPGLGRSLHEVLGRLAELDGVPHAPVPVPVPVPHEPLTLEVVGTMRDAATALSRSWHLERGEGNVWHGLNDDDALDGALAHATAARAHMHASATADKGMGIAFATHSPDTLARLLEIWTQQPATIEPSWLTAANLDDLRQAVPTLAGHLGRIRETDADAAHEAGVPWTRLPPADTDTAVPAAELDEGQPPAVDLGKLTAEQAGRVADVFLSDAGMLERRSHSLEVIAEILGLPVPRTLPEAGYLLFVASMSGLAHRPERAWFTAGGAARARAAADALHAGVMDLDVAEKSARSVFKELVLWLDLSGPAGRYESHRALRRLSPSSRDDRARVAAVIHDGIDLRTGLESLSLAMRWQSCHQHFAQVEIEHSGVLGSYYTGRTTDFALINRVLADLGRILHAGVDLSAAAGVLAADAQPPDSLLPTAARTRHDLETWRRSLGPAPAAPPEFGTRPLLEAAAWMRAQVAPARAAAELARTVSAAVGRDVTTSQALHLVELRQDVENAHERFARDGATLAGLLGDHYRADDTDIESVRSTLDWTDRVRIAAQAPDGLTPLQLDALTSVSTGDDGLRAAVSDWHAARDEMLAVFDADRRPQLAAQLDDDAAAGTVLRVLAGDRAGRDEMLAHRRNRAVLVEAGLEPVLAFCREQEVPGDQVADVAERALLQGWVDARIAADPALAPVPFPEHELQAYRTLDRTRIATAAGEVAAALADRRPHLDGRQTGTIAREAGPESTGLPVRQLLADAREAVGVLTPCVLATPGAASRHLSADTRFDTVIIDEAGRLTVGEALGAVHRGDALIVVGDQQQLPPDGAVESVLDLAQQVGTFTNLPLPVHYRSRHDALIAFSNEFFYGGDLITFPAVQQRSTQGCGPGVIWAGGAGAKDGGAGASEAELVAERVAHHVRTRPGFSLGVVTFTPEQVTAVELAVEALRAAHPELEPFFTAPTAEPFFVCTADEAQGDERDVVILPVGYSPDADGVLATEFGPLEGLSGWRRLNVAVTRARHRTETVCSVGIGDFPAGAGDGLLYLRHYLEVAAVGQTVLSGVRAPEPLAALEQSVADTVRSWGYEVLPGGSSPAAADLAVRHPDHPERFVLGIRGDGDHYGSTGTARDRDRLYDQALTGLGWHLHRIRAAGWQRDRAGEERRLRATLEHVRSLAPPAPSGSARPVPSAGGRTWAVPYRTAVIDPLPGWVDLGDPVARPLIVNAVRAVVAVEAPVHLSVVQQRLRDAWSTGRGAGRLRAALEAALAEATDLPTADGFITNGFITGGSITDGPAAPDRARLPGPACARRIDQITDGELAVALLGTVADAGGMLAAKDFAPALIRCFGWSRRTPEITARVDAVLAAQIRLGRLRDDEGTVAATG